MEADEILLLAVLDQIEQCEARLLTWGLVDGHVSAVEMHGIVDSLLDDPSSPEELQQTLEQQNIDQEIARDLARDIEQLDKQQNFDEQVQEDSRQISDALNRAAEQMENPTGEGEDENHRILTVSEILLEALNKRFAAAGHLPSPEVLVDKEAFAAEDTLVDRPEGHVTVFDTLDMSASLNKADYRRELSKQQRRIHLLQREA